MLSASRARAIQSDKGVDPVTEVEYQILKAANAGYGCCWVKFDRPLTGAEMNEVFGVLKAERFTVQVDSKLQTLDIRWSNKKKLEKGDV